jgi:hypothetical protein
VLIALLVVTALPVQTPLLDVGVDSARHEVVLTAGPFVVPASHGDHAMGDHRDHQPILLDFRWPVAGWARGFTVAVTGANGRPLARSLLHHLNVVNFERRQLVHPAYERLIALGRETEDVSLPRTIGIPLDRDGHFALLVAWGNETHEDLSEVRVTLRIQWSPANTAPAPRSVLLLPIDAHFEPMRTDAYDLPPGPSERAVEFSLAGSGRLLAIGGHLHDYATDLRIEEVETGRVVVDLVPVTDGAGKVTAMPRKLPGITGDGIALRGGRRYRLVARYDNPTGRILVGGAMAVMAGIFAPDRMEQWALTDVRDLTADAAGLAMLRDAGLGMIR